jgi:hypothetical protein
MTNNNSADVRVILKALAVLVNDEDWRCIPVVG